MGINLWIRNRMHFIFIENGSRVITTKHVSFDENIYLLMRNNQYTTFHYIIKNTNDAHVNVTLHDDDDDVARTSDMPHFQSKVNNDCD